MQFKWQTLQEKETSFFNPHLTPRKKMKIPKPCNKENPTISRVLFVYSMKCRQSSSDTWGIKNENSKKPYCASVKHTQSDPIIQLATTLDVDSVQVTRSSSDRHTDGRTGVITICLNFLQKVPV